MRFRAPKNENFSEQAVRSFQLKLLILEINRAEKGREMFKEKLETDRSNFRENMRPELMPSFVGSIRREMRNHSAMIQRRVNGKLDKLSGRQDRPLRNGSHSIVVKMDGREPPEFVPDILSMGPKNPVRDKFNEVHFLAEVDKLVRELRENNKSTYMEKLDEVLNSDQFQKINEAKDDIVIKNEKQINNNLQHLMKQGKISDKFLSKTQVNRFTTIKALCLGKGA